MAVARRSSALLGALLVAVLVVGAGARGLQARRAVADDVSDGDSSAADAFQQQVLKFSAVIKRRDPLTTLLDTVLFRNRYLMAMDKVGELMGVKLSGRVHIKNTINENGYVRVPSEVSLDHPYDAGVFYSVMKHNTELLQGSFVDEIGLVRFEDWEVEQSMKDALRG